MRKTEPPLKGPFEPWTQDELNSLHEMVQEYERMKWLKGKAAWWAGWTIGLPAIALTFWEPLARLWKLLRGG